MLSLVAACAQRGEPASDLADDPVADGEAVAVFRAVYAAVADRYITPIPVEMVAARALTGFTSLDSRISVTRDGEWLILRTDGKPVRTMSAPPSADADAWARATVKLWRSARQASPTIAEASAERMYEVMFRTLAGSLDRFSTYATATQARQARERRDGQRGLGLTWLYENGFARVVALTSDGPAQRAGLRIGDALVSVDGESVSRLDEIGLVRRLEAGAGERVSLVVQRPGQPPTGYVVMRRPIIAETVTEESRGGIVRFAVSGFNQGTLGTLTTRLNAHLHDRADPLRGIILDLRGNPGGLLQSAVRIGGLFLDGGPIVATRGRHPDSEHMFLASGRDIVPDLPIIVLIDGETASAAEVLAAALKDRHRAVVIGTRSFGKGLVQTVVPLPNQGEIGFTWSRLVSPSGADLHVRGVAPSLCTASVDRMDETAITAALLAGTEPDPVSPEPSVATCPSATRSGEIEPAIARWLINNPGLYALARGREDTLTPGGS
ncbi:MAG: S41 family peptidase [Rhodospirillales bacterium]